MMRIQGFRMGHPGFQKPVVQRPPSLNFSLAAGSPSGNGGADSGAAASSSAPSPGAPVQTFTSTIFIPPPNYALIAQEMPYAPPPPTETKGIPTWAIVGGAMLIGMGIAALLLKRG